MCGSPPPRAASGGHSAGGRGRRHGSVPGSPPASRGSRTLAGGSAEIQRQRNRARSDRLWRATLGPSGQRPPGASAGEREPPALRSRTAGHPSTACWAGALIGRLPASGPDARDGSPPVVTRQEPWAALEGRAGLDPRPFVRGDRAWRPDSRPVGRLALRRTAIWRRSWACEPCARTARHAPKTAHPFDMAHCARPVHKPRDAVDNRPARGGPAATERGRTAPERGLSVEMPKPPHLAGRHPNEPLHLVFFA